MFSSRRIKFQPILISDASSLTIGTMSLDNTGKEMQYKVIDLMRLNDNTGNGWKSQNLDIPGLAGTSQQIFFQANRDGGPQAFVAVTMCL